VSEAVARYFFHLCDGSETLLDPDGREVADKSSLRDLAIKDARAIISHDALTGSIRLDLRIEVRDSNGEVMCEVPFRDAITINP
jgi:uncharacterized protein DUF6894